MSTPGETLATADADPKSSLLQRLTRLAQDHWRTLVLFVPFAWLLIFFLAPFFIVLKISMAETTVASPPFTPMIQWVDEGIMHIRVVVDNFAYLWEDDLYVDTYLNSLKISVTSTILCLLLGYPIAYAIARSSHTTKHILLMLIILPFWTSFLLRVYAWMGLLADQGTINDLLIALGLIDEPIRMLYNTFAVYVGIVYTYVPFMILPLYANMEKLDWELLEAAADLGAKPTTTFFTVTLPMTVPGIVAGSLLVFIPATGEYVIPDLLGGGNVLMIGRVLYNEFNANVDWPVASAVAIALLLLLVLPMMLYQHIQAKEAQGS
ncbi:MAG: Putrescine transport system permease protein PotH (TC 3.A.1.11.2) [Olavius algarvensis Gamma 3 endosymbiont]|nr:MAG: Putrescine transport system permease protein PotH (TC 3.A.1.11.2) [Olavius algarvensis Gamma 3 endosymbiont]